ncbi:MAG: DUF1150 family protein [Alphaproteobacteria bacterium]|nr:DUF1150 family protein [Alphaproteobacteria bacterium]
MDSIGPIRHISAHEFAAFGMQHLAFVKQILAEGVSSYAIHAADGTQIAILPDRDIAFATVRQHDLEPVSVH